MGLHEHSITIPPHDHNSLLYASSTGGYIPNSSFATDYFKEEYDHYIIEVEAPRFTKNDLEILFKDDIITVNGDIEVRGRTHFICKIYNVKEVEDFDITLENGVLQIIAHKKPETLAKKLIID